MAIGLQKRSAPETRVQKAVVQSLMAPTGGINARDALANMPPTDAVAMTNWFPQPSYVAVRNGSQTWATGLPGAVETVMAYNGVSAYKLFAAAAGALYDVTTEGAVGAAIVSGLTSARWQHAMFNAGGGSVLLAVNGSDAPQRYDGATQGALELLTTLVGGSSYTNGTYTNVALTGGSGTLARATIVVTGNVVTSVTISANGSGYVVGDVLSAASSSLGGTGSGFSIVVQQVGGWSVMTISGTNTLTGSALIPANLITVTVGQQRCWYIEKGTMNVWYGATSAFQGVLTLLPLGQIFKMGGYLMQAATWTIDNVSGINDYMTFITSEGEVAVYQGYDPSSIATWSLVGVFVIGRPIGRRCVVKYGSDVLCICADGLTPFSQALLTDRTQPDIMLTDKIRNALNSDVATYGDNFGWEAIEHPIGTKLILNVPEIADSASHQWVMNTTAAAAKSWTQFTGWAAFCWERQQDDLYFGGNGVVVLADVGNADDENAITVDCLPAFSYFGTQTQKRFLMCRPIFRVSAPIAPSITLNVDFDNQPSSPVLFTTGNTSPWGP